MSPVLQTGQNFQVAFKRQTGIGVYPSGAGAVGLNVVPQQGLTLSKAYIESKAARKDGQHVKGRHGTRKGASSYQLELAVGQCDDLLEAMMRGTWVAAASITNTAMTSVTSTTTTIIAAAGSWITQGVRRGDKIQLTGFTDAANNGKWFRVVAVSTTTITLANTVVNGVSTAPLIANATPDSSFTVTVAKTVINGTTPVERYYTAEEYGQDTSVGMIGHDLKISKFELDAQPDSEIMATFSFTGLDIVGNTSSANFTSPTYSVATGLVMADGTIRINGVDYNILTGFKLTWDLGGTAPSVLALTSPDVFLNGGKLTGTFTALRSDLTFFNAFSNETPVDFFIDMVVRGSAADPRDFISIYVGDASLTGAGGSVGQEGAFADTVPWGAGIDLGGTDRAATSMKLATSAP